MRRYERNGVDIDQCTECRGIFLDRGELERLTEAENSHYGTERGDQADSWGGHGAGGRKGRGKKSFLDDLFD